LAGAWLKAEESDIGSLWPGKDFSKVPFYPTTEILILGTPICIAYGDLNLR